MNSDEAYEAVRRAADPSVRGRLATDLLGEYQRRTTELARIRREAMRQLQDRGLSYAAVAEAFGLSKGRVGQIAHTGPAIERALFGTGPITVAVPLRPGRDRTLPVLASEDALASERLSGFLRDMQFEVETMRVPVGGDWTPAGDVVAICGPKSSPVTARALAADPVLDYRQESDGRWVVADRVNGSVYRSPMDDDPGDPTSDIAYLGRLPIGGGGTMLVIAGVHALGSVGAVDYLIRTLPDLYRQVDHQPFSMVTRSRHDGERVLESEAACVPRLHA